jgi:hypothetical protein
MIASMNCLNVARKATAVSGLVTSIGGRTAGASVRGSSL